MPSITGLLLATRGSAFQPIRMAISPSLAYPISPSHLKKTCPLAGTQTHPIRLASTSIHTSARPEVRLSSGLLMIACSGVKSDALSPTISVWGGAWLEVRLPVVRLIQNFRFSSNLYCLEGSHVDGYMNSDLLFSANLKP